MARLNKKLATDVEKERRAKATAMLEPGCLIRILRKSRHTTKQLQEMSGGTEREVMDAIADVQDKGYLLYAFGDEWGMEKAPPMPSNCPTYKSRRDGSYKFGFSSDQHLGSKYERLDVLNSLYDKFVAHGVDRVFNAGNYIDGEARFNAHDLKIRGLDAQIDYLCDKFPERDGLKTYVVSGDDHEGWYGQKFGIDIGAAVARRMKELKRRDWVNLGFMESFIRLEHAKTGECSHLLVMHPGGGSSYADSYRPQKIVESFSGGEKPGVLLIGHYHKLGYYPIRNVHAIQSGCTQDQTPFMRKKGIQAHVGGGICELKQDPNTGAIIECKVQFFNYYNEGYYNNRWNHGGDVVLPERGA